MLKVVTFQPSKNFMNQFFANIFFAMRTVIHFDFPFIFSAGKMPPNGLR